MARKKKAADRGLGELLLNGTIHLAGIALSNGTVIGLGFLALIYLMVSRAPADEMLQMLQTILNKHGLGYGLASVVTVGSALSARSLKKRLDACDKERKKLQDRLLDQMAQSS